jgi:hypothetical protein
MFGKQTVATYVLIVFGVWAGAILALFTLAFFTAPDPLFHALIGMASGLGYIWVVGGGLLMWRFRDSIRDFVRRIPLDWRLKFVLFATVLALTEEAITTTMTNLAPLFGVPVGRVYITASANYLDVVLFHSVIVLIPEFIAWAWLLTRIDFSPNTVFVLYGLTGTLGETLAFGPQNLGMIGFWVFVYGLMIYLPTYTLPTDRVTQTPRWYCYLLAMILPLLLVIPVVLVITKGLHHPGFHFPPIQASPK